MEESLLFAVVIAVIAIALLQVVTMVMISGSRKQGTFRRFDRQDGVGGAQKVGKGIDHRRGSAGASKSGDGKGAKPQPPQQQQNKPQQSQTAAIDPMEKSLRDINLRLKNAEREQESARKNIRENNGNNTRDGRPQQPQQRGGRGEGRDAGRNDVRGEPNRGEGRNDAGRNDGFRNDRPPRRDIPRRDQHPDARPPEQHHRGGHENAEVLRPQRPEFAERPAFQERPMPDRQPIQEKPQHFSQAERPNAQEPFSDGVTGELQHGRKFTAKRRTLPENVTPNTDALPEAAVQPTQEHGDAIADIGFGRNRR